MDSAKSNTPTLRLVAWNILHGGGPSRIPEIALALRNLTPDIVVLSEFRDARGGQLRVTLADAGLEHQAATPPAPGSLNSVFPAARHLIRILPSPPDLGRRFIHAHVGGIDVCGVHVPDDANLTAKSRFWQALLNIARGATDRPLAILGDFNTGRRGQDGVRFACEALLGNLLSLGFVDAWRVSHPIGREDTWVSPLGKGRIDTTYLSPALADTLVSCEYDHRVREAGFSDHSAVIVDLARSVPTSQTPPNGLFSA